MSPGDYTEDTLVQQTTAEYLEQNLGWDSAYAYNNEDFGPDTLLGRASDRTSGTFLNLLNNSKRQGNERTRGERISQRELAKRLQLTQPL